MKMKNRTTGWYMVEADADDYYSPDAESEGPHATADEAMAHATTERPIVRYLADDGYLYVDEPEHDDGYAGTAREMLGRP
jgi:hypothetical protein